MDTLNDADYEINLDAESNDYSHLDIDDAVIVHNELSTALSNIIK